MKEAVAGWQVGSREKVGGPGGLGGHQVLFVEGEGLAPGHRLLMDLRSLSSGLASPPPQAVLGKERTPPLVPSPSSPSFLGTAGPGWRGIPDLPPFLTNTATQAVRQVSTPLRGPCCVATGRSPH